MQLSKNDPISRFISLFQQGYEAWVEAGKVVASEIDKDPEFPDRVHEHHPEVGVDTVLAFDRLGRRELHPKLLISDSPGAKKLRRMPYSIQEKHVSEPLPLLIRNENKWETLSVNVFNLTSDQANQIFDGDSIRTPSAQRAWLEDRSARSIILTDEPYRVTGRKLIVMQPCQLSSKQLARILADME